MLLNAVLLQPDRLPALALTVSYCGAIREGDSTSPCDACGGAHHPALGGRTTQA
jgi:hypothetical protein